MVLELNRAVEQANHTHYNIGQKTGHYESYFLRANHPSAPRAFWIRYTIFSPHGNPDKAIGEIWAMFFDKESGEHIAVKEEFPLSECSFRNDGFDMTIGKSHLEAGKLQGQADLKESNIKWDMIYKGDDDTLFLYPLNMYEKKLPRAKSLVGLPMAFFSGSIVVNGREIRIEKWAGSQNHNWGTKHTDYYAWGQIAGFDNALGSFFEIGTARLKLGPVWTPFMTIMVLRHNGREYALNNLLQTFKADGKFDYFTWNFCSEKDNVKIKGTISADLKDFVGLTYFNPPGGEKYCLNSKIASCRIVLEVKEKGKVISSEVLETESRAAFEILTDDRDHGVKMFT